MRKLKQDCKNQPAKYKNQNFKLKQITNNSKLRGRKKLLGPQQTRYCVLISMSHTAESDEKVSF